MELAGGSEPSQPKDVPDVAGEAERVEYGEEVEEGLVVWVREPAVDWNAIC
jgi:hypothetical protein